jgi:hypothetical protein
MISGNSNIQAATLNQEPNNDWLTRLPHYFNRESITKEYFAILAIPSKEQQTNSLLDLFYDLHSILSYFHVGFMILKKMDLSDETLASSPQIALLYLKPTENDLYFFFSNPQGAEFFEKLKKYINIKLMTKVTLAVMKDEEFYQQTEVDLCALGNIICNLIVNTQNIDIPHQLKKPTTVEKLTRKEMEYLIERTELYMQEMKISEFINKKIYQAEIKKIKEAKNNKAILLSEELLNSLRILSAYLSISFSKLYLGSASDELKRSIAIAYKIVAEWPGANKIAKKYLSTQTHNSALNKIRIDHLNGFPILTNKKISDHVNNLDNIIHTQNFILELAEEFVPGTSAFEVCLNALETAVEASKESKVEKDEAEIQASVTFHEEPESPEVKEKKPEDRQALLKRFELEKKLAKGFFEKMLADELPAFQKKYTNLESMSGGDFEYAKTLIPLNHFIKTDILNTDKISEIKKRLKLRFHENNIVKIRNTREEITRLRDNIKLFLPQISQFLEEITKDKLEKQSTKNIVKPEKSNKKDNQKRVKFFKKTKKETCKLWLELKTSIPMTQKDYREFFRLSSKKTVEIVQMGNNIFENIFKAFEDMENDFIKSFSLDNDPKKSFSFDEIDNDVTFSEENFALLLNTLETLQQISNLNLQISAKLREELLILKPAPVVLVIEKAVEIEPEVTVAKDEPVIKVEVEKSEDIVTPEIYTVEKQAEPEFKALVAEEKSEETVHAKESEIEKTNTTEQTTTAEAPAEEAEITLNRVQPCSPVVEEAPVTVTLSEKQTAKIEIAKPIVPELEKRQYYYDSAFSFFSSPIDSYVRPQPVKEEFLKTHTYF